MIPVPQALKRVLTCTASALSRTDHVGSETLDVFPSSSSSLIVGRIAAETIKAPSPGYPPYNASIMDGYAISTQDIRTSQSSTRTQRFTIKGRIHAGPQPSPQVTFSDSVLSKNPHVMYVTTGAVIPSSYDAVIPLEQVTVLPDGDLEVSKDILKGTTPLKWIRPIGCDIPPETILVKEGEEVDAIHLGLLVQCSVMSLKVRCLPKVRTRLGFFFPQ